MKTQITVDVRYPDCDMMGIVHHAVYPIWLEIARMDLFDKIGFSFSRMHALGIDPPMVDLHMQYRNPMRYPGQATIRTHIRSYAPKKLELVYQVYDQDGGLAADATSFHIWTGPDAKSISLMEKLPQVYEKIQEACETDDVP